MGYLFVALALSAGVVKGYCGKKTSGYVSEPRDAAFANMVRMLICILIGFFVVLFSCGISSLAISARVLWITVLSGVGTSLFVVSWLLAVRKGAYMLVDVFLLLGMVVPIGGSALFFHESIRYNHWIGFAILLVAVLLLCSYNNSIKTKLSLPAFLLLCLSGLANGVADFSQKLFVKLEGETPIEIFNFYTYVFAAITLAIFFFTQKNGAKGASDKGKLRYILIYIPIMAVCLFLNSLFKTYAALYLDAAILYPLNMGAALMLSSLMAAIFFGEKLKWKSILAIILAFTALITINML